MRTFHVIPAILIAAATAIALDAAPTAIVSLSVQPETAPPGARAQMKVFLTEPKPILTGDGLFSFSAFEGIDGISTTSPNGDAAGIAHVVGTNVALSLVSPTSSLGTDSDYPLVAILGRVPRDASLGTEFSFPLSADSIRLFDPFGNPYLITAKSGSLVVGPSISIGAVVPGSADLPAGGVVSIQGMNFRPDTKVRFDEVALAQVRFVDSTHIDVVVAEPVRMHGLEIKAENPNDSRVQFFSYQRTTQPKPSSHPLFRHAVPVFASGQIQDALVQFPSDSAILDHGIALENVGLVQANVILEMTGIKKGGAIRDASAVVTLPVNQRLVRDVSELFGLRCGASCSVRVTSTDPIHVLGVVADVDGRLRPVLPQ
jgi:hypothetical protein